MKKIQYTKARGKKGKYYEAKRMVTDFGTSNITQIRNKKL